jgi:hypothetical protein
MENIHFIHGLILTIERPLLDKLTLQSLPLQNEDATLIKANHLMRSVTALHVMKDSKGDNIKILSPQ